MASADPFSLRSALSDEVAVRSLAYAQGVEQGARHAVAEGRAAGLAQGWQAGTDIGAARALAALALALPWALPLGASGPDASAAEAATASASAAARLLRTAQQLQQQCLALLPLDNRPDCDLVHELQRVRARAKVLSAVARLPAASLCDEAGGGGAASAGVGHDPAAAGERARGAEDAIGAARAGSELSF